MTSILNFFSHIGSYLGVGAAMLVIGLALVILAIVKLSRMRKAERSRTVAEFNRQFVIDTRSNISDVDAASRRREIAGELGITGRR